MRQKSPNRPALALGVAGLALALAACSPITTTDPYAASDGIRAQVGDLEVLNLMIVAEEEGAPGLLLGAASSSALEESSLTLASIDGELEIFVPLDAGQTVNFYTEDDGLEIESVPVPPGANLQMTLTDAAGETVEVYVPVLDATLVEYQDAVPIV